MKIAVIGSGISGLSAAYFLSRAHNITLYEKNSYIGGHSRTINITGNGQNIPVDTGFIVYNEQNYPLLCALFRHLGVATEKSNMSFGVSIANGWLEYSSNALFAQQSNLWWRMGFCRMMRDVVRFNRQALSYLDAPLSVTLGKCLDELKMGPWFRAYYLQPMGAAIWSCSTKTILEYPARTFIRFFKNHGLLTVNNQPQWYTVTSGSREYLQKILTRYNGMVKLNCGVVKVTRGGGKVRIEDSQGEAEEFDHVVFAGHADETLNILSDATELEKTILGSFKFQPNKVIVHSDESFMPRRRKAWASWIYLSDKKQDKESSVSLSYWMNSLQNLKTDTPVFVTLNPGRRPQEHLIHDEHEFSHPIFNESALAAQERIGEIQGAGNIWHCGAWQRYGFHEDGLLSAVRVVEALGVELPWE